MQTHAPIHTELTPEVIEQAQRYQLGNLHGVYMPKWSNPIVIIAITLGVIAADILLFLFILMLGWIVYYLFVIPILAIIFAVKELPGSSLRVYDFDYGFIKVQGKQIEVVRWERIESVWQEVVIHRNRGSVSTSIIFKVHTHENSWIVIKGIENITGFASSLQRNVDKIYLPQAQAAFEAGQPITFGPLYLHNQGITEHGSRTIAWEQVYDIQLSLTALTIRQKGDLQQWTSLPIANIPNLTVLYALTNKILAKRNHQIQ